MHGGDFGVDQQDQRVFQLTDIVLRVSGEIGKHGAAVQNQPINELDLVVEHLLPRRP